MERTGNPIRRRFYMILHRFGDPKNLPKSIKKDESHWAKTFFCSLLMHLVAFLASSCIFLDFEPICTPILGYLGPVWSALGPILEPTWPQHAFQNHPKIDEKSIIKSIKISIIFFTYLLKIFIGFQVSKSMKKFREIEWKAHKATKQWKTKNVDLPGILQCFRAFGHLMLK